MSQLLAVAAGGALGSVLRWLIGSAVQARTTSPFPMGTLLVNITGAFVIGFAARMTIAGEALSPTARLFLITGVCGGYTTFSAFSLETVRLFQDRLYVNAALYMTLSVVLSIAATCSGMYLAARPTH